MPRRRPTREVDSQPVRLAGETISKRNIFQTVFAKSNRGLLLDIVVFILNIFLMRLLTAQFIDLFKQVSAENPLAKLILGLTFAAMWILPAAGAVLKRWHFHQRRNALTLDSMVSGVGGSGHLRAETRGALVSALISDLDRGGAAGMERAWHSNVDLKFCCFSVDHGARKSVTSPSSNRLGSEGR